MAEIEVLRSATFAHWIDSLKDRGAAARIGVRITRLVDGNPGDTRPVGSGISEMRVNHGPGYRVYYLQQGSSVVLLLCGGDKSTQVKDINKAHELAEEWRRNG